MSLKQADLQMTSSASISHCVPVTWTYWHVTIHSDIQLLQGINHMNILVSNRHIYTKIPCHQISCHHIHCHYIPGINCDALTLTCTHSLFHSLTLSNSYELTYEYGIYDSDLMVSDSKCGWAMLEVMIISLSLCMCVRVCACEWVRARACVLAVSNKALVSVCFVSM